MAYIIREDGEHFVIPSYRDVLDGKQKNALKKDILLLSQSYGNYITLQKKNANQYELAFSPDIGYLLGESIWQYFKRPLELIYCEAIPNTTESILVIVKNGSVYLDGRFPNESIPEELIIFLSQQNSFEIFTYGDVPISEHPEEDKFNFEASSVKSFTVLEKPVFASLPLMKAYQLQLVDTVLKAQGIGVFPYRPVVIIALITSILWMFWNYQSAQKAVVPEIKIEEKENPYLAYNMALNTPAPEEKLQKFIEALCLFLNIPGWTLHQVEQVGSTISALVDTPGAKVEDLMQWAKEHGGSVNINERGIYVILNNTYVNRPIPNKIYPLKEVIGLFIDQLALVNPGNQISLGNFSHKQVFSEVMLTIKIENVSPLVLSLVGQQLKGFPFAIQSMSFDVEEGNVSGSILIQALGS